MKRYAPSLEEDGLDAYWGKEAKSFVSEGLRFDYLWTPGPGINEHLLTVTPEGFRACCLEHGAAVGV